MNSKLTPERLLRKAVVYIRQSKPSQLIHNQESTRLQFSLADRARTLGFQRIVVVDDDQGRTGSGLVDRPGFQRLAAEVCSGEVGAVFCVEASRLARNGRDWHHLIDLCGMVGAVVVTLLPEFLRIVADWRMTFFGALLVLAAIWRPDGLLRAPTFK